MNDAFHFTRKPSAVRYGSARISDDQQSLLARTRSRQIWLRFTAVVVAIAFLNLYLQPVALAASLPALAVTQGPTNDEKLSRTIETIEQRLAQIETRLEKDEDAAKEKSELTALRQELDVLDDQAGKDFDAIEIVLKDKRLPQLILDRHYQAVKAYKQGIQTLKADLDELQVATEDGARKLAAQKARAFLIEKQTKRTRQPFNPNQLPNQSLAPNPKNKPKTKREDFVRAALYDNPRPRLAALGDFRFDKLPGAADPAYLSSSAEIVLTDAIKAKARELDYSPVKINQWVRNNVEWTPTWGAFQNADLTLSTRRGNAIDVASLTIALLRASGIPARYVHGVIELPAPAFTNWVGDFADVIAAQDYASTGGIPTASVVSGGLVAKVRMEHVWVEAAIDYYPSRGAINRDADAWVAMDPSFKQYEYHRALDLETVAGVQGAQLAQSYVTSGVVNAGDGWVNGLDPVVMQNAQQEARQKIEAYIVNNMTSPTVVDVIGGRRIVTQTFSGIPAAPSNRVVIIGSRYAELPDGLRNFMSFGFGTDIFGDIDDPIRFPWAKLNNERITLSFRPASPADEQALLALLPSGQITDIGQIPASIPAYLVHVIPELKVNGLVVKTGTAMNLGMDLDFVFQVRTPLETQAPYTYKVIAGSYLAIGSIGQNVSAARIRDLQMQVEATRAVLQGQDQAQILALTRENVLGEVFHAGILSYFGQYNTFSEGLARQERGSYGLAVGYGSFGYEPYVNYFFGVPRAITPGGAVMNIRMSNYIGAHNGDVAKKKLFAQKIGLLSSALEHAVPEQIFATPSGTGDGISAVKALAKAQAAGQRIYQLTPGNQSTALPNIHQRPETMDAILAALAVGKQVIAHTDPISVSGWVGAGYIVLDPDTGAGAYMISGGANGGGNHDGLLALSLSMATLGSAAEAYAKELAEDKMPLYKDLARQRFAEKIALAGKFLGGAALAVDILEALTNDSLSVSSKVGRIAVAMFGFGVASVVGAAIATTFAPVFAAIFAALFVATLTILLADFSLIYFSAAWRSRRHYA